MSSSKKITLKSSVDGHAFEVDVSAASESQTIKQVIESGGAEDNVITLPNITGKILSKVIEYCKKQMEAPPARAEELKAWEGEFVKVDTETLTSSDNGSTPSKHHRSAGSDDWSNG